VGERVLQREDAAKGGARMVCTWDVACAWCAQGRSVCAQAARALVMMDAETITAPSAEYCERLCARFLCIIHSLFHMLLTLRYGYEHIGTLPSLYSARHSRFAVLIAFSCSSGGSLSKFFGR